MAVGDNLVSPLSGYQRIDDFNINIKYIGSWTNSASASGYHNSTSSFTTTVNDYFEFYFYGTKFKIIDRLAENRSSSNSVYIDEVFDSDYSGYKNVSASDEFNSVYEKDGLEKKVHHVKIIKKDTSTNRSMNIDAIDIDDDGYMCTEMQYEIQEAKNRKFPVMIGDSTITSEENIANYANTLTSGERQVLIMESGDMFLTDGQGGYKKINSSDGSSSGGTNTLSYFSNPNK